MPIYVFECPDCGFKQEVIQRYNDPIPVCGDTQMVRKPSASSIRMTGFRAETGYASSRTIHKRFGSIKTTVTGTPEAFVDGLAGTAKERRDEA